LSQSGVVQSDQTTGSALNNHLGHNIGAFGGIDHSGIEEICAGERISSFRNCLKRYDFVRVVDVGTNLLSSGASLFTKTTLPLHPTDGSTIMKYTSSAFAGWRGSQRVKVLPLVYLQTPLVAQEPDNQSVFICVGLCSGLSLLHFPVLSKIVLDWVPR
jgi:hypothetical protein